MTRAILIIPLALILLSNVASAFSLRSSIPVSASYGGDELSSGWEVDGTSGYSLRGISGFFFGLGYSSSTISFSNSAYTTKYGSTAVDFSIDPIDFISLGYGPVISGSYSGAIGKLDSISGSTTFLDLNFGIGPIDL